MHRKLSALIIAITALILMLFYSMKDIDKYLSFQDFTKTNLIVFIAFGGWFWVVKCRSNGIISNVATYTVVVLLMSIYPMVDSLICKRSNQEFILYNIEWILVVQSAFIMLPLVLAFPRLNKIVPALISFGVLTVLLMGYVFCGTFSDLYQIVLMPHYLYN